MQTNHWVEETDSHLRDIKRDISRPKRYVDDNKVVQLSNPKGNNQFLPLKTHDGANYKSESMLENQWLIVFIVWGQRVSRSHCKCSINHNSRKRVAQ